MNFNLFSIIAASAVSASVALPAHASEPASSKPGNSQTYTQTYTPTYTPKYLQQSANFYAALDHKISH